MVAAACSRRDLIHLLGAKVLAIHSPGSDPGAGDLEEVSRKSISTRLSIRQTDIGQRIVKNGG